MKIMINSLMFPDKGYVKIQKVFFYICPISFQSATYDSLKKLNILLSTYSGNMKYSVITKDSFIVLCLHLTPNYPSGGGLLIMIGWTFPDCLLPYSEKKNETQVSVQ